ncbi:AAA family ATPase [Thermaurantiacus tibetensis]|uniref:AAA family ATPase n=1 Tax=Thermaurantiacus tibetensis TaxID=2759035 RepID=UPI00188F2A58|nr:hypothetical protein [Thermaurantiacus tibetensis]
MTATAAPVAQATGPVAQASGAAPGPGGGQRRPFLGFATDPDSRRAIAMAAAARGWDAPEVVDGGLDAAHARLAAGAAPGFLVIDLSASRAPLPEVDALAELCDAETRVIAIGTRNDVALYRGLRALGVSDYLLKPVTDQQLAQAIDAALETLDQPPPAAGAPQRQAQVVALVGTRGGAGTSALAAALAAQFARDGRRTVLLDLDFQGGSLALDLDLEPAPGVVQLLQTPDRLDPLVVAQAMRPHAAGFRLLAADAPIEAALAIEPDAVLALVTAAGAEADVVVADLPRWLDRARRAVLRTADHLALVTPLTLPGLRDARRMVALATGLRAGQRPLVVANRVGASAAELDPGEFAACLGGPLDLRLPEVPAAARAAAEGATTLLDAAPPALARPLAELAGRLAPEAVEGAGGSAAHRGGGLVGLVGRLAGRGRR